MDNLNFFAMDSSSQGSQRFNITYGGTGIAHAASNLGDVKEVKGVFWKIINIVISLFSSNRIVDITLIQANGDLQKKTFLIDKKSMLDYLNCLQPTNTKDGEKINEIYKRALRVEVTVKALQQVDVIVNKGICFDAVVIKAP
jgi:hypothetical protein